MVNRTCAIDPDGAELAYLNISAATASGQSAEGVVVTAIIVNSESESPFGTARQCTFGALAPVALRSVLAGTASVTGGPVVKLSGDAFLKAAIKKAYKAKRATIKAKYRYAVANYKLRTAKTSSPFAVSAQYMPTP